MDQRALQALDTQIAERRADKEFIERIRLRHEQERELMERLAGTFPSSRSSSSS